MELKLTGSRLESSDTMSFVFEPQTPVVWKAGQFLRYVINHPNPDDRGTERYFSISAAPHEHHVMLTTRFAPKGSTFKEALKGLKPGDVVQADELDGDFIVDDFTKDYIFVAGGIGITPYRAILLDADHRKQPINVVLLYANRNEEFPFRQELEALRNKHPRFTIEYYVSPKRIDADTIRATAARLKDPAIYVSGPEPMVESFQTMLKEMGIPEDRIKTDFFPGYDWPG